MVFLPQRDDIEGRNPPYNKQTDSRAAFLGAKLNAMIHGSPDIIIDCENDLIAALEEYRQICEEGREPF